MASAAQILANQQNAQFTTGPRTPEGKAKSARNSTKLGLFSMHGLVLPHEEAEHQELSTAIWQDVLPKGALQESLAVEIIRATWRLQRCARVESDLIDSVLETGLDPMQNETTSRIQLAVDRARTHSQNSIRRATADLRRLQTDSNTKSAIFSNLKKPELGLASVAETTIAVYTQKKAQILDGRMRQGEFTAKALAELYRHETLVSDGEDSAAERIQFEGLSDELRTAA